MVWAAALWQAYASAERAHHLRHCFEEMNLSCAARGMSRHAPWRRDQRHQQPVLPAVTSDCHGVASADGVKVPPAPCAVHLAVCACAMAWRLLRAHGPHACPAGEPLKRSGSYNARDRRVASAGRAHGHLLAPMAQTLQKYLHRCARLARLQVRWRQTEALDALTAPSASAALDTRAKLGQHRKLLEFTADFWIRCDRHGDFSRERACRAMWRTRARACIDRPSPTLAPLCCMPGNHRARV